MRAPSRRRTSAGPCQAVVELDAFAQPLQVGVSRLRPGLDLVDLVDLVPRMREPVCEVAVVREQERAGRVRVEPPDRNDTRRMVDEIDDGSRALAGRSRS